MASVTKRFIILYLKFGLGLALLTWVICSHWSIRSPEGDQVGILSILQKSIGVLPFLLACVITSAMTLLTFFRWFLLVRAQKIPITLVGALRLGLIGFYLNIFLPGSIGGDIIKVVLLGREHDRAKALATVLVDRLIGLCSLFWLVAFVGGFCWAMGFLTILVPADSTTFVLDTLILSAMGLVFCSLCFWAFLGGVTGDRAESLAGHFGRCPKIGHTLARFWQAVWFFRRNGGTIALALCISLVSHAGTILAFYFAALTIFPAQDIPGLGPHLIIVPVGMIVRAGFPTPGGLGGSEFVFGELYTLLTYSFVAGVLSSLVTRAVSWIVGTIGFLVYVLFPPASNRLSSNTS